MKITLRALLVALLGMSFALTTFSQTHEIDSLQQSIRNTTNDSTLVLLYTHLGNSYFSYDTIKSQQYFEKGFQLAKKMQWDYALADYYQNKGIVKNLIGDQELYGIYQDSAIASFKRAALTTHNEKALAGIKLSIATCFGEKASILANSGRYKEAVSLYIAAMKEWESSNEPHKTQAVATYNERIATAYYNLKDYKKSLFYDKISLSLRLHTRNEEAIAYGNIYVADDFIALKQVDSSQYYLSLAKPYVERLNNHLMNIHYYAKIGRISRDTKDYPSAINYFKKCISEATISKSNFQIINNTHLLATCYIATNDYPTARKYLLIALPMAIAGHYASSKIEILQDLVKTEEHLHNIEAAHNYLKRLVSLRDSVNREKSKNEISEIENKYQANEKAKEITLLKVEKENQKLVVQQKSTSIVLLVCGLLSICLISVLGYLNFRNKQLVANQNSVAQSQRIKELELEKQLISYNSLLKGQEAERSRVAKDLHDGLGGMLSGIKLSLGAMKGNVILSEENTRLFARALDQLDYSISEMRRVAHNMMPEALIRLGLQHAVQDYCSGLSETKQLHITTKYHGLDQRLDATTEVVIYRVIQELLNNIVKHAKASEVLLQIMRYETNLNITVEDNGTGFDITTINQKEGSGLSNIRSRVEFLKGQLDIQSSPGKGTSVLIDCPG